MMNTENVVPHLRKEAVNPVGDLLEGGVTTGIKRTAIHGRRITMLLNQILSRENMLQALKRVEQNKGSHGVDMMPVQNCSCSCQVDIFIRPVLIQIYAAFVLYSIGLIFSLVTIRLVL
ncbi:hypothetical protein [Ureibacillus sp. FSL W8-0352]|uniref:hypothetical protein n=1 Tax=Ureibacillus sp. FSL W8-0352 TaxID=2954596 RepID=UPI0030FCB1CA